MSPRERDIQSNSIEPTRNDYELEFITNKANAVSLFLPKSLPHHHDCFLLLISTFFSTTLTNRIREKEREFNISFLVVSFLLITKWAAVWARARTRRPVESPAGDRLALSLSETPNWRQPLSLPHSYLYIHAFLRVFLVGFLGRWIMYRILNESWVWINGKVKMLNLDQFGFRNSVYFNSII